MGVLLLSGLFLKVKDPLPAAAGLGENEVTGTDVLFSLTLLMPGLRKESLLGGASEGAGGVFGSFFGCGLGDADPLCWGDSPNRMAVVGLQRVWAHRCHHGDGVGKHLAPG